ncbi:RICIN domain-containing protein [Myxococcus sp. K38C18041901]|uniref:RICIN domain-containing protein n=1 Tax=Myxococcus guangdongensis TaxID=2906760 RepID=UPI0020A805E4|nr:RICIN domain-containing protein [Myxococcus guangdongensis]MCP3057620.1 RICIN domain-containing protein [Myxococcus guangdongensis]
MRGVLARRERIRDGSFCLGARGRHLVSARCDDSLEQQWVVTPFEVPGAAPPPGFRGIRLKSAATGGCVEGAPEPVGGARIRLHPECLPQPSQQWNVHRSVFERLLMQTPPEAARAPQRRPRASGDTERLHFYSDESRTLLVGWRDRDCLGAQTSWGVSSPHETRVSTSCPGEAGGLE